MRILEKNLPFLHTWTHGYFAAKKYFKGRFIREIDCTLFDIREEISSYLHVYVTTGNILFYLTDFQQDENVLIEIESTDKIEILHNGNDFLKTALNNQSGAEQTLSAVTTRPIDVIKIDDRYIIFTEIQPEQTGGPTYKLSFKKIFIVEESHNEKVANFAQLLKQPRMPFSPNTTYHLPGLKPAVAYLNIYGAIVAFILIQSLVVGIIAFDPNNRVVAIIAEILIIYSMISWLKKK